MSVAATQLPLAQRLMEAIKVWITTPVADAAFDPEGQIETARNTLCTLAFRERDEDTTITPESDRSKDPRFLCKVDDQGRIGKGTPIRAILVSFTIRGNAAAPRGESDPFHSLCGAVEKLIDSFSLQIPNTTPAATYLTRAFSSEEWQVATMLAVREAGIPFSTEGDIRKQTYQVKVRAVGMEFTE